MRRGFSRYLTVLGLFSGFLSAFLSTGCFQSKLVDNAAVSASVTANGFFFSSIPSSTTNSTTGTFVFTYSPSDAAVTCEIDGGGYNPCASPQSFAGLADGAHTVTFLLNGGAIETYNYTWTVDSAAPAAPGASLASATPTANATAQITIASCAGISHIFVNEGGAPAAGAAGWQPCSTVAGAITYTMTTNGNLTLSVWAKDLADNVSATSTDLAVDFDNTGPAIVITEPDNNDAIKGGANFDITWTATDSHAAANTITIDYSTDNGSTWNNIVTNTANDGTHTWAAPAIDSANVRVRISAVDSLSNSASVNTTGNVIDQTAPTLTAGQMALAAGSATSTSQYVAVALAGTDNLSNITEFCLKYNSTTAPTAAASCWVPVNANPPGLTPATTLSLSGYLFQLGFVGGAYTVYAWLKDAAGNISSLTAAGAGTDAQDRDGITFSPGSAPTIVDIAVVDKDPLPAPVTSNDTAFENAGDFVYIHWDASDDGALGDIVITLYYTTDDTTWTQIATGIAYNANTNCTVAAGRTGCYRWSLPAGLANTYFRIRVKATDGTSMASFTNSTGLNVWPPINFLAGNTEPGIGASSTAAVFFNNISVTSVADPGSLVVASNGTIYFRDIYNGILKIDPSDGVLSVFIPRNSAGSSSAGDGGQATSATVRYPIRIALDYSDRLLIWDYDRIRRVETNGVINTFIGGGADAVNDGIAPTDVSMAAKDYNTTYYAPFYPLPNGDLIFMSGDTVGIAKNIKARRYVAASNTVTSFTLSGTGDRASAVADIQECYWQGLGISFDPASSAINYMMAELSHHTSYAAGCNNVTNGAGVRLDASAASVGGPITNHPPSNSTCLKASGRDGKLYCVSRFHGKIDRYDDATASWTTIVGILGAPGTCADGTAATSCNIEPQDVFVTQNGTIFFMDRGRIRAVDAAGDVVTVAGQGFNFGDGGSALSARFGSISDIALWDNAGTDTVILLDNFNYRFREFEVDGNIATIAGNGRSGTPTVAVDATGQPLIIGASGTIFDLFEADSSGSVYFNRGGNHIGKLVRGTPNTWSNLVGGGGTSYTTAADGTTGANIGFNEPSGGYPFNVIANDGTNVLVAFHYFSSPSHTGAMLHAYSMTDGSITRVAGVTGAANLTFCAPGTALNACNVPHTYGDYYLGGSWDATDNAWIASNRIADSVRPKKLDTVGSTLANLVTLPRAYSSFAHYHPNAGTNMIYYCGTSEGRLYKYDILTSTETALNWPVASMSCTAKQLLYSPTRSSLIFVYKQNNMYGIAEYLNP